MKSHRKLTEKDVEGINKMFAQGKSVVDARRRYGVSLIAMRAAGIVFPDKATTPRPKERKVCGGCGQEKELDQFLEGGLIRKLVAGKLKFCIECRASRKESRLSRVKQLPQESDIDYSMRRNRINHRLWVKEGRKDKLVTQEEFDAMFDAQDGRCAICNTEMKWTVSKHEGLGDVACVDHCHDTGKVRELLCGRCNVGIGYLRHSTELFSKAIAYLKKHESTSIALGCSG